MLNVKLNNMLINNNVCILMSALPRKSIFMRSNFQSQIWKWQDANKKNLYFHIFIFSLELR